MSTFRVEVVPVRLEPHPNADALSIVRVFGDNGYVVVVRTIDWVHRDTGAYIPPDSVVPDAPEYAFLATSPEKGLTERNRRIAAKRLRGIYSEGLLMPAPAGARVGDDVAALMGIVHYEPPLRGAAGTFGEAEAPPTGMRPVYDLEHHKRHGGLLIPGERVIISEKLHGANARYCFHDGRMYAGSRKEWKREGDNIWWKALRANMEIEGLCRENPGLTLYGEIYGDVQDLRYGMKRGEVDFAAFDLYRGANPRASAPRRLLDRLALALGYQRIKRETGWLPYDEARTLCDHYGVQWVPVLFDGPYEPASLPGYTDGPTTLGGDHVREGCVVRPARERMDTVIGRVHLKLVSAAYLERSMKETA